MFLEYLILLSYIGSSDGASRLPNGWVRNIDAAILYAPDIISSEELYRVTLEKAVLDLRDAEIVPMNVTFKWHFSQACDEATTMNASWKMFTDSQVDVFIGPECSAGLSISALFAANSNLPAYSTVAASTAFEDKTKYFTLSRMSVNIFQLKAIAALLNFYNWSRLVVLRSADGSCDPFLIGMTNIFSTADISIVGIFNVNFTNPDDIAATFQQLKITARIALICAGVSPDSALYFLKRAVEINMEYPNYVYITAEYNTISLAPWQPWLKSGINSTVAASYIRAYKSAIVIVPNLNKEVKNFSAFIDARVARNASIFTNYNPDNNIVLSSLYNNMYLYGIALNRSFGQNRTHRNGDTLHQAVKGVQFTAFCGPIRMNNNADRVPFFSVLRVDKTNTTMEILMKIGGGVDQLIYKPIDANVSSIPDWGTPDQKPIRDVPTCGFMNNMCPSKFDYKTLIVALACLCILAFGIAAIVLYRRRKVEFRLLQSIWTVDVKSFVVFHDQSSRSIASRLALGSGSEKLSSSIGTEERRRKSNHEIGTYNGIVVYSRKFKKKRRIIFSRKELYILKRMKELKSDNIDPFIGLAINDSDYLFSFWSYCQRGSLADVLFNDAIKMDQTFQTSLIRDIVSGLCYLHDSSIGYHGLLYSKNCLVDSRWTVKLTNYGICDIYESLRLSSSIEIHAHYDLPNDMLICTAPEILRKSSDINMKMVDIYQFSMITYQILYRKQPFENLDFSAEEVISMLKTLDYNGKPLRPSLHETSGFDVKFLSILETCWQESPSARINAATLKKVITSHSKKYAKNLIDHVLKVLEQYTNNLERIVEERTEKMLEERRRADNLLYQILPKMVADSLKHGVNVSPEVFDCATIYFSSIIGFASICSQKKPRDIVNILNDIYQVMDKTIAVYDAYKVETISDSYLVISGVPVKNGMEHTSIIADLSLELLKVMNTYHVTFQKNQLSLRIGLNCGPVAAGVVGIASPRYCLFGDTVNVASRIETNGEAGKIHMSESLYEHLVTKQRYSIEKRGEINLKGKGLCVTYWLLSRVDHAEMDEISDKPE